MEKVLDILLDWKYVRYYLLTAITGIFLLCLLTWLFVPHDMVWTMCKVVGGIILLMVVAVTLMLSSDYVGTSKENKKKDAANKIIRPDFNENFSS